MASKRLKPALGAGAARAARVLGASACLLVGASAWAQGAETGIYTCVDAKGRKLTSDRPIAECADREQKVLNPSGTVKARIGPVLTAQQQAEQDARDKAAMEERARAAEEKRRDRAMVVRYPNKTVHDRERVEALNSVMTVISTAELRAKELQEQRAVLNREMEFYQKDPSKAPPMLRRQLDENTQNIAVQQRFIVDKQGEIKRVNDRFDEELLRLKQLWLLQRSAVPASAASKAP